MLLAPSLGDAPRSGGQDSMPMFNDTGHMYGTGMSDGELTARADPCMLANPLGSRKAFADGWMDGLAIARANELNERLQQRERANIEETARSLGGEACLGAGKEELVPPRPPGPMPPWTRINRERQRENRRAFGPKKTIAKKYPLNNASASAVERASHLPSYSLGRPLTIARQAARLRAQPKAKPSAAIGWEDANEAPQERSRPPAERKKFAVLVDAENVNREFMPRIFREVEQTGEAVVKIAYADWSRSGMGKWSAEVEQFGMSTVQVFSHARKNSSDMHMTVDGIDLLRTHPDITSFAIVSSDSDFRPLARRLREAGKEVLGFGDNRCSAFLVGEFTAFKFVQQLASTQPEAESPHKRPAPRSHAAPAQQSAQAWARPTRARRAPGLAAALAQQGEAHEHGDIAKHMMEAWASTRNAQGWSYTGAVRGALQRRGIDCQHISPHLGTNFEGVLAESGLFDIKDGGGQPPGAHPVLFCRLRSYRTPAQARSQLHAQAQARAAGPGGGCAVLPEEPAAAAGLPSPPPPGGMAGASPPSPSVSPPASPAPLLHPAAETRRRGEDQERGDEVAVVVEEEEGGEDADGEDKEEEEGEGGGGVQASSAEKHGRSCQMQPQLAGVAGSDVAKQMLEAWASTRDAQGWSNAGSVRQRLHARGLDRALLERLFPGEPQFVTILHATELFDVRHSPSGTVSCRARPGKLLEHCLDAPHASADDDAEEDEEEEGKEEDCEAASSKKDDDDKDSKEEEEMEAREKTAMACSVRLEALTSDSEMSEPASLISDED